MTSLITGQFGPGMGQHLLNFLIMPTESQWCWSSAHAFKEGSYNFFSHIGSSSAQCNSTDIDHVPTKLHMCQHWPKLCMLSGKALDTNFSLNVRLHVGIQQTNFLLKIRQPIKSKFSQICFFMHMFGSRILVFDNYKRCHVPFSAYLHSVSNQCRLLFHSGSGDEDRYPEEV